MDTARLFINGKSQAVRLPKGYRFKGSEVYLKKIDDIVLLLPKDKVMDVFIKSLDKFSDDFLDDRNVQESFDKREAL